MEILLFYVNFGSFPFQLLALTIAPNSEFCYQLAYVIGFEFCSLMRKLFDHTSQYDSFQLFNVKNHAKWNRI